MSVSLDSGHSPAPWHLGGNGFIVYAGNGYAVCDVKTFHGRSDGDEANARLIAAAPELLNALRILHDNIAEYARINNLGGFDNQDMVFARAAIAKATRP